VPATTVVPWAECAAALSERKIEDYGKDPKVSLSFGSVIDAARKFGQQDSRRVICCVSPADGAQPGGGYLEGLRTPEAELCRRLPALYPSLLQAKKQGLYPFGPSAGSAAGQPSRCSDVLYTPHLDIARGELEGGLRILHDEEWVKVALVSAAPPRAEADFEKRDLVVNTIASIFASPVHKDARCTTLVMGAWGCGQDPKQARQMLECVVEALLGTRAEHGLCLGRLYHEIHFAMPPRDLDGEEDLEHKALFDVLAELLTTAGVPYREL